MPLLTVTGYCSQCPQVMGKQKLIAGMCLYHYWGTRRTESYLSKGSRIFRGEWGNVQFRRNIPKRFDDEELEQLIAWFNYHDEHSPLVCENCGNPLPEFAKDVRLSHHAHILPKAHFKSVLGNINNHLTLGGMFSDCGCHYAYDASWARVSRMPVITIVTRKFLLFRHEIALSEVKYLPEFLLPLLKTNAP
jgi:hypothetical protein